jgi:hypothetical protein
MAVNVISVSFPVKFPVKTRGKLSIFYYAKPSGKWRLQLSQKRHNNESGRDAVHSTSTYEEPPMRFPFPNALHPIQTVGGRDWSEQTHLNVRWKNKGRAF